MNRTTYLTKLDIKELAEQMKQDGLNTTSLEEELETITDGAYICNLPMSREILAYPYFETGIDALDYKKRLEMMGAGNFGSDEYFEDSKLILKSLFLKIKGMTLDDMSASMMVGLFKNEADDLNEEDYIDALEFIVEMCEWKDEDAVYDESYIDLKSIPETYNDGSIIDKGDRLTMLIEKYHKEGYHNLHKIGIDNYLEFGH